jgi:hypothetical protein
MVCTDGFIDFLLLLSLYLSSNFFIAFSERLHDGFIEILWRNYYAMVQM